MSNHTDIDSPPSREGLEDHQVWVWLWNMPRAMPSLQAWVTGVEDDPTGRWEIRGTGAKLDG